jgi:hypothetical protein
MYVFEILLTFSQKNGSVGRRRNTRRRAPAECQAMALQIAKSPRRGEWSRGADTLTTLRQQLRPCQLYTPPNHISK